MSDCRTDVHNQTTSEGREFGIRIYSPSAGLSFPLLLYLSCNASDL